MGSTYLTHLYTVYSHHTKAQLEYTASCRGTGKLKSQTLCSSHNQSNICHGRCLDIRKWDNDLLQSHIRTFWDFWELNVNDISFLNSVKSVEGISEIEQKGRLDGFVSQILNQKGRRADHSKLCIDWVTINRPPFLFRKATWPSCPLSSVMIHSQNFGKVESMISNPSSLGHSLLNSWRVNGSREPWRIPSAVGK